MNATYAGVPLSGPPLPSPDWGVVGTAANGQCDCIEDFPHYEFAPCPGPVTQSQVQAECGCPLQCVGPDPYDHFCELPCHGEDDCPWNSTCQGYPDGTTGCAPTPECTDAGALCDPHAGNPGTCLPMWTYLGPKLYCFEGGGQIGPCDPDPLASRRHSWCHAGSYCLSTGPDGGSCVPVCDPSKPGGAQCPSGTHCGVVFDGMPSFGACVACLPPRAPCQTGADCCDGDCEPGCSFDYTPDGWGAGCRECR